MITVKFVRQMARYNSWQNQSCFDTADLLDAEARKEDCGAYFGSIHGTLCHLLWADTMWMSRFDKWPRPSIGIPESAGWVTDWPDLASRRRVADAAIIAWADKLDDAELTGDLVWFSDVQKKEMTKQKAICVAHFFNHQAHHRGQVHAMLTAAGAAPDDTDLVFMPEV